MRFVRLSGSESLVRRVLWPVGGGLRCGRLSCCVDRSSAARTLAASRSATTAAARFGLLLLSGASLSEMFCRDLLTAGASVSMSESIGRLLFCGLVLTAGTSSSLSDTIALLRFAGRGRRIDGLRRGAREHLVFRRLHGAQAPPFASTRQIDFFSTQHSQGGLWILSVASARFFTLPDALVSPAPAPPFPVSLLLK